MCVCVYVCVCVCVRVYDNTFTVFAEGGGGGGGGGGRDMSPATVKLAIIRNSSFLCVCGRFCFQKSYFEKVYTP